MYFEMAKFVLKLRLSLAKKFKANASNKIQIIKIHLIIIYILNKYSFLGLV